MTTSLPVSGVIEKQEHFGVLDDKGREIGCSWTIQLIQGKFEFRPHATRDGRWFGAIPVRAWKTFDTLEQAQAHAAAYVKSAHKRAWAPKEKTNLAEVALRAAALARAEGRAHVTADDMRRARADLRTGES